MEKKLEIQRIYGLSPMQEGMLYHSLLEKNSSVYFTQLVFDFNGKLDVEKFEKSFNLLVERHDILRTIYIYEKVKSPKQVVIKERTAKVRFVDISSNYEKEKKEYIDKFLEDERHKGFNLAKDMLFKISIFKTQDNCYKMIWSFHHIIIDGWCLGIIIKEMFNTYQCLLDNKPVSNPKATPYIEFIKWLEKKDKEEAAQYWDKLLEGYEHQAVIPAGIKKGLASGKRHNEYLFILNTSITSELKNIAKANCVTLNIIIQAIWGILLQKYNNTTDVVFGTVVSGRTPEISDIENIVGLFINTVPVRVKVEENQIFSELVKELQEISLLSEKYDYLSIAQIQSNTHLKNNLISQIIAFENYPVEKEVGSLISGGNNSGFSISGIDIIEQTNYDFNTVVFPGDEIHIKFRYNPDVYDIEFIRAISKHFLKITNEIISDNNVLINDIDIVTDDEKKKLLFDYNDSKASFPDTKTIHELFEEQAEKYPDRIALAFENASMTYGELNEKAGQLAYRLRNTGVEREKIVAVIIERSFEMIIAALAVLKAGGAYLPINPDYPEERIRYMLEDSEAEVIITTSDLKDALFDINIEKVYIDMVEEINCVSNLQNFNKPSDLAYVIYTSGSTGRPKGAMIEHRNVVRLLYNDKFQFDFNQDDVWTMFHSFCFDFSVWEMYGALLYGGKLVIVPRLKAQNPAEYLKLLKENRVTVLNQTPTAFYNLSNEEMKCEDKSLGIKYVIFGGEALKPSLLKEWSLKYPETKLINMYGITETTVHVTYKEITHNEIRTNESNIGKPIPTLTAYIFDRNMKLVPFGIPGELCVGGDGVGRGYLNRNELTSQKFKTNPYKPGERIYRSGDLVKMHFNGEMEYLGRIDQQVKIRGHRIELGEVENELLKIENIKDAIVIDKDVASNKCLCAYIVCDGDLTVTDLKENLLKVLPEYMIPAYFVRIEKVPLTQNGKVDRRRLPEPVNNISSGVEYAEPSNDVEEKLAAIWKEVLGVSQVGVNDNFFDLGGDSLATIRVLSSACSYNWNIEIQDFYKFKTIKAISDKIRGMSNEFNENIHADITDVAYINNKTEAGQNVILSGKNNYSNILLTGATGFLGIHLLSTILEESHSNVYCLVRGSNNDDARCRLNNLLKFYFGEKYAGIIDCRVFVINGDVTSQNFGLSKEQYDEIGEKTDLVIHTAALVKHYGNYETFRKVNVLGTMEIIKFCKVYDKRLSHISTISVSGSDFEQSETGKKFSENDFYIGQKYAGNVYVTSKFEAENLVLKAINNGMKATIFRVGNLTGRFTDGHFQINPDENKFYGILRSIIKIGAIPLALTEREVEFTPIDLCSKAVFEISRTGESAGRVFHIYNHNTVNMRQLLGLFGLLGIHVEIVNNNDFKNIIDSISRDKDKREKIEGLITNLSNENVLDYKNSITISSGITVEYLKQLGFEWPEVEVEYIKRIICYIKSIGFVE